MVDLEKDPFDGKNPENFTYPGCSPNATIFDDDDEETVPASEEESDDVPFKMSVLTLPDGTIRAKLGTSKEPDNLGTYF